MQNQLNYQQQRTRKEMDNLHRRLLHTKETIAYLQAKYEKLEVKLCTSDEVIRKHERRFKFFFGCLQNGHYDMKNVNFMDPPAEG